MRASGGGALVRRSWGTGKVAHEKHTAPSPRHNGAASYAAHALAWLAACPAWLPFVCSCVERNGRAYAPRCALAQDAVAALVRRFNAGTQRIRP